MAPGDAQETHTSRSAARQPQTVPPVLPEKRKQAQATTFPRARFVCYAVFTALGLPNPVPRIHTWVDPSDSSPVSLCVGCVFGV